MTHFANKKEMLMNCCRKEEKGKMGKEASLVTEGDIRGFRLYAIRRDGDSEECHCFYDE